VLHIGKTKTTNVAIGQRRKPKPDGIPGFLRVDTVHQGDLGKMKGVYHINLVDEVTQWEVLVAVEEINESILKDVLEVAILLFPFAIKNFHPYLNFYRPCYFPERTTAKNGKVTVKYPRKNCMTPYRKLRSLKNWQKYLRPGVTVEDLERQCRMKTPLQAAQEKIAAREQLFSIIIEKHPDTDFPEKMS